MKPLVSDSQTLIGVTVGWEATIATIGEGLDRRYGGAGSVDNYLDNYHTLELEL